LVALALAIYLVTMRFACLKWIPFNSFWMFLYFGACVISAYGSPEPLFGSFTVFKLAKSYLLYWTVYNMIRADPQFEGMWWGLICGGALLTYECLKQKYMFGLYRVYGTFDHSNGIPIFLMPHVGLLMGWVLSGAYLNKWKTAVTLGVLAGICGCVVFTQSRLGLIMMGATLVATQIRSVPQRINVRKCIVGWAFLSLIGAGIAYALPTIIERFENAPKSSKEAREEFNYAAHLMADDNFFGVGINQFANVMTNEDRYNEHVTTMGNEAHAGVCHHIYLLNAAEIGYLGCGFFIVMIIRFQLRLFRGTCSRMSLDTCVVIGLFVGLSAVHLIGLFEWSLRTTQVYNWFVVANAIGISLTDRQIRLSKQNRRQVALGRPRLVTDPGKCGNTHNPFNSPVA